MNSKLKSLIFDFEGTLVDFQWRLDEAEAEAGKLLAELGIADNTQPRVHYAQGMNMALEYAERHGKTEGVLALSALYDRYDADALDRWQVRPGVQETLPRIRAVGLKTGLVSNVGIKSLKEALIRLGLIAYLDVIVSRNEALWLKPHPRGINLACEQLGCGKDEVCFLGDSLDDIQAARRAGVPVIIISGGQHSPEKIQETGPNGIIGDWKELLIFLEKGRLS